MDTGAPSGQVICASDVKYHGGVPRFQLYSGGGAVSISGAVLPSDCQEQRAMAASRFATAIR
eukprot:3098754-Prymnesium_polylepis.3